MGLAAVRMRHGCPLTSTTVTLSYQHTQQQLWIIWIGMYTIRWPLRGCDMRHSRIITDCKLLQTRNIFAGKMYWTTCVECAGYHFVFFTYIYPCLMQICAKNNFYSFIPSDLWHSHLKLSPQSLMLSAKIRSIYSFPISRKSEAHDGRTERKT